MDIESELWTKKTQLLQLLGNRQFSSDDLETDEDVHSEVACPYCHEDFDIVTLCSHLEEHCFNSKLTMCPFCAAEVENDVVGHISTQHANHFKSSRKFKFRKSREITTNLEALLEATRATNSTDSFLQSLVSVSSEEEEVLIPENPAPQDMVDEEARGLSLDSPPLSSEEKEERIKQAACRAEFARHLVLSTIWPDS